MNNNTNPSKGKSSIRKVLGTDNEWGRPAPYVWFLIIMVSLIPLMILGSVIDVIPCTEQDILNGITPEQYLKEKHFTIQNAVKKCTEKTELTMSIGKIISGVFFGTLIIALKPWPFNSLLNDKKQQDQKDNTERRTPI